MSLDLKPLELQILRLVWDGWKLDEIDSALRLTRRQTTYALNRVFQKLGARHRIDAVRIGLQRGYLRVEFDS